MRDQADCVCWIFTVRLFKKNSNV